MAFYYQRLITHTLLLASLCLPAVAIAHHEEGFWSIQLENDLWGSNKDRFYTNGIKVSFSSVEEPPGLLNRLPDYFPWYQTGETRLYSLEIAQTIFTPEDISATELVEDDRPYAGWLHFDGVIGHIYDDRGDRDWINLMGFNLGIVGPSSLAEEMQNAIHELSGSDDAQGWDNQLQDELGINLWYVHKYRRIYNYDERLQYEIGPHYGFMLGNVYSYANAGVMLRYGTQLKGDIGPPSIAPGFTGAPAFNPNYERHWYVFAGLEVRLVARDIFLDGNSFRDSHSVEKKPFVMDLELGISYHFNDMRLSFVQMFHSREFDGQDDPEHFGAINLTFYYE